MSLQLDEDIHELRRVQDTPQTNEFKSCIVTFTSTTTDRKLDKQSDTYYADVLELIVQLSRLRSEPILINHDGTTTSFAISGSSRIDCIGQHMDVIKSMHVGDCVLVQEESMGRNAACFETCLLRLMYIETTGMELALCPELSDTNSESEDTDFEGDTEVGGDTNLEGDTEVEGDIEGEGDTEVEGNTVAEGDTEVDGDTNLQIIVLRERTESAPASTPWRPILEFPRYFQHKLHYGWDMITSLLHCMTERSLRLQQAQRAREHLDEICPGCTEWKWGDRTIIFPPYTLTFGPSLEALIKAQYYSDRSLSSTT